MTKINERQFINQFANAGIDINQLSDEAKKVLEQAGVDLSKLDTNKDGVIKGQKELASLFNAVDSFDTVKDRTIDTTYGDQNMSTIGGMVNETLLNEFNRNVSQAQISGPHRTVATKEKTSVSKKENDLSSLPPTFDKDYYLKLAEAPDDQLKLWYHEQARQDPKFADNLRTNYTEVFNEAKMSKSEKAKLDKLGDKLQTYQNERSSAWATEQYGKKSQNEIAKGFIDRIQIAEQKSGPDGRQAEINKIMQDVQFLAASGKGKADEVYSKAFGALQQAMKHEYPNTYAKEGKLNTMPRADLIEATEKLQGAGSAEVKADLIKTMLQDHASTDEKYPGAAIETLIKSDPGGLAREFEAMASNPTKPEDKQLLNYALDAVYRAHRKDPQKAADVVGEMLGKSSEDLAAVTKKRPFDAEQIREIKDHGHRVGFLVESTKHMVKTISDDKKKAIDEGAFIAGIFTKAVSKLTNIPGIKDVGNDVISDLKKKEYEGVDQWQKGVEQGYFRILDTAFYAGKPDSRGGPNMKEFDRDLQFIHDEVRNGMNTHAEFQQR